MSIGYFVPPILMVVVLSAGILSADQEQPPPETIEPPVKNTTVTLPNDGRWNTLVATPELSVELDKTSVKIDAVKGGFEVHSRLRIQFFQEIEVANKKEKGWYYVNDMTCMCKKDTIRVDKSVVFTKNHKVLATGTKLGELANPRNPKSFVSVWLHVACSDLKNKPVPTII